MIYCSPYDFSKHTCYVILRISHDYFTSALRRELKKRRATEYSQLSLLERLRFTFTANGKRQTQVEHFSEQKISRYKYWHKTTYFCVEAITSERKMRGKLGQTWYKFTSAVWRKRES